MTDCYAIGFATRKKPGFSFGASSVPTLSRLKKNDSVLSTFTLDIQGVKKRAQRLGVSFNHASSSPLGKRLTKSLPRRARFLSCGFHVDMCGMRGTTPKHSMCGKFTYSDPCSQPNVCQYMPYMDIRGYTWSVLD